MPCKSAKIHINQGFPKYRPRKNFGYKAHRRKQGEGVVFYVEPLSRSNAVTGRIFDGMSEIPVNFDRHISCPRNTLSDHDFVDQNLHSFGKALEVDYLALTKEFDRIVNVGIVGKSEDGVVHRSCLLLC